MKTKCKKPRAPKIKHSDPIPKFRVTVKINGDTLPSFVAFANKLADAKTEAVRLAVTANSETPKDRKRLGATLEIAMQKGFSHDKPMRWSGVPGNGGHKWTIEARWDKWYKTPDMFEPAPAPVAVTR